MGAMAFATTITSVQETMSPLVKQMSNGAWPDKATIEQLNQERLYCSGTEFYDQTRKPDDVVKVK